MPPLPGFRTARLVALALAAHAWAAAPPGPLDALEASLVTAVPMGKQVLEAAIRPLYDQIQVRPGDEEAVGRQLAAEIRRQNPGRLDVRARDRAYLDAVGQRVARGAGRRDLAWTFHLLETPTVNAFAHCGGHVYVCRGLLDQVASEAQLAAILGHEVAHVDRGHTSRVIKALLLAGQINQALPLVSLDMARFLALTAKEATGVVFQEALELEADEAGLGLAFQAGYDPSEGARYWDAHPGANRGSDGLARALVRSHPTARKRADLAARVSRQLKAGAGGRPLLVGAGAFRDRTPGMAP